MELARIYPDAASLPQNSFVEMKTFNSHFANGDHQCTIALLKIISQSARHGRMRAPSYLHPVWCRRDRLSISVVFEVLVTV